MTIDDNAPRGTFRDLEAIEGRAFPHLTPSRRANRERGPATRACRNNPTRVGIIGNGAGLVMSTLDVVAQAGARAANFLDVGGGASADQMATSLEVVLSDPAVRAVFINIFGGITRCDLVAQGVLAALERVEATVPIVVGWTGQLKRLRRPGSTSQRQHHPRIVTAATMLEAAQPAAAFANEDAA